MSVDFLSKNFPPFQVHHAKKPPRFYPDGFQRNVIDFYLFFRIVGSEKPYICSFPILYGPYDGTVEVDGTSTYIGVWGDQTDGTVSIEIE